MKKYLFLLIFTLLLWNAHSQEIYLSSNDNKLYRLNLDNCINTFLVEIQSDITTDISFHPNGNLYGINQNGDLYEIDIMTGAINIVHTFNSSGGAVYNSLTINADGLVYAANQNGDLYSYDTVNGNQVSLGDIGYDATGDLTFYDGDLYVAVFPSRIVRINVDNPSNSTVVIDQDISQLIYGIVSFAEDCNETSTYALTNVIGDGISDLYEIDFNNNSYNFICELDISVYGGASTFEFLASDPLVIENIDLLNPDCGFDNGELTITASGGTGQLAYSIDGVNFQTNNSFENLAIGNYIIYVVDENDCLVNTTFQVSNLTDIVVSNVIATPTDCGQTNGSITLEMEDTNGQFLFSINNGPFNTEPSFSNLPSGEYQILIEDELSCQLEIQLTVGQNDCDLYIPNVFSPNDDGFNDIFTIFSNPAFTNTIETVHIFDRWGGLVYQLNNVSIDDIKWDGTLRGSEVSQGVYVYVIKYKSMSGQSVVKKGEVTVIR